MSTGTGTPPACVTASHVAMNVWAGTITSVSGLDARGKEREPERVEAARGTDAEVGPAVRREIPFEGLHDRAVYERAGLDHVRDRLEDLRPQQIAHVVEGHEGDPTLR